MFKGHFHFFCHCSYICPIFLSGCWLFPSKQKLGTHNTLQIVFVIYCQSLLIEVIDTKAALIAAK